MADDFCLPCSRPGSAFEFLFVNEIRLPEFRQREEVMGLLARSDAIRTCRGGV